MSNKNHRAFQPEIFKQEIEGNQHISEASDIVQAKKKKGVGVTIVFPESLHESLRSYSYHERQKINPLIVELTSSFLKDKGYLP